MPRGRIRCLYVMDDETSWSLMVDADSVGDPARDWLPLEPPFPPFAPRALLPRKVVGIDDVGHTQTTRVGSVNADLWTGVQATWFVEGTDGQLHEVTRIATLQEKLTNK